MAGGKLLVHRLGRAGHHLAGGARLGIEELVGVPALGGHFRDRVAALPQHVPEFVGVGGPRKPRCVSDDRKSLTRINRVLSKSHNCLLPPWVTLCGSHPARDRVFDSQHTHVAASMPFPVVGPGPSDGRP